MKIMMVFAVLLLSASCVTVAYGREVFFGQADVGFRGQHGAIEVGDYDGWFRNVVVRAKHNAVEIFEIRVVYGNGEVENLPEDLVLTPGQDAAFHVDGSKRKIRRINFTYRTVGKWRGERASILVWGTR